MNAALLRRAGAVLAVAAALVALPVLAAPAFAAASDAAVTVTNVQAQVVAGPGGRLLDVTFHAVLVGAGPGDEGQVAITDQYFPDCSGGASSSQSTNITAIQTDYEVTMPVPNESYVSYTLSATLGVGDGSEAQVTGQTFEGAVISPATFNTGDLDADIEPDDATGATGLVHYQTSNAFDHVELVQQGGGTATTPVSLPVCASVFETWQGLAPGQTLEIVDPATGAVLDQYTAPGGATTPAGGMGASAASSNVDPATTAPALAETGVDPTPGVAIGALLLVGGVAALAIGWRRRTARRGRPRA